MALNPNVVVVAPNELITSAHVNNIRANLDRLDVADTTNRARRGVALNKTANQTMLAGTSTTVSWSAAAEDTDGFWTSGTPNTIAKIPAGFAGIYVCSVRLTTQAAAVWPAASAISLDMGGVAWVYPVITHPSIVAMAPVPVGQSISVSVVNPGGAGINVQGFAYCYRMSI